MESATIVDISDLTDSEVFELQDVAAWFNQWDLHWQAIRELERRWDDAKEDFATPPNSPN